MGTRSGKNSFVASRQRLNYHRERFRKLTFRALALRQSEQWNCGVLLVYMGVSFVAD